MTVRTEWFSAADVGVSFHHAYTLDDLEDGPNDAPVLFIWGDECSAYTGTPYSTWIASRCEELRAMLQHALHVIDAAGDPKPRVPLESCVCGGHFDCPDGFHCRSEMPCSCTADCALADDESEAST